MGDLSRNHPQGYSSISGISWSFWIIPLARIAKARYDASRFRGLVLRLRRRRRNSRWLTDRLAAQNHTVSRHAFHESRRQDIEAELFPTLAPDEGRETAYLRYWYGKIIEHYRGSGTKLIFMRVPRAPVSPPDPAPKLNSAIRQIASQPDVIVLDEATVRSTRTSRLLLGWMALEPPGDGAFSRLLGSEVRRVLGPPKS